MAKKYKKGTERLDEMHEAIVAMLTPKPWVEVFEEAKKREEKKVSVPCDRP